MSTPDIGPGNREVVTADLADDMMHLVVTYVIEAGLPAAALTGALADAIATATEFTDDYDQFTAALATARATNPGR